MQGAAALRVSLQQDMLAKAPTMISLRKVLTPLQMARLIVNCWPFYSTMVRPLCGPQGRAGVQGSVVERGMLQACWAGVLSSLFAALHCTPQPSCSNPSLPCVAAPFSVLPVAAWCRRT